MTENEFPLNRYNIEPIIEYIRSLSEIPDVIEVKVEEPYLEIEISDCNTVDKNSLLEIISHFTLFDNMMQSSLKKTGSKYLFEPALIQIISNYEVHVGYWATNFNSEYLAVFWKQNGEWVLMD